jgi:ribosomal-protein-alanine N-acetyltransferase
MAALHALAFVDERPWTSSEFAEMLKNEATRAFAVPHGFALTCTAGGDTELLMLAVHPAHRRHGIGRALTLQWLGAAQSHADLAFLEVADDNLPALALYTDLGFGIIGRRTAYYARKNAPNADALVMQCALPLGKDVDSPPPRSESS